MYMSPEQLRSSKNVDTRTDIWALGVILYELVSGRFPFEDATVTGLCARIAADPPVPLHEHRPDVPADFEAVVSRCLSKGMKDRPQTVAELAALLRPFASAEHKLAVDRIARIGQPARSGQGLVPDAHPSSSGGVAVVSVSGGVRSTTGFADTVGATSQATLTKKSRATPAVLVVGGALAAALLGGGLFLALRSTPADVAATAAPPVTTTAPATAVPPPAISTLPPAPLPPMPTVTVAAGDTASASAARPASKPAPVTATPPARPAGKPTPTSKPPSSDDLLLDRK
jgi:serine/threonine-protein kinase